MACCVTGDSWYGMNWVARNNDVTQWPSTPIWFSWWKCLPCRPAVKLQSVNVSTIVHRLQFVRTYNDWLTWSLQSIHNVRAKTHVEREMRKWQLSSPVQLPRLFKVGKRFGSIQLVKNRFLFPKIYWPKMCLKNETPIDNRQNNGW